MAILPIATSIVASGMTATSLPDAYANASANPDRTRPRVSSQDPTQSIDRNSSTTILSFPVDRPKYYISFAFEEYRRPSMFEGLSSNGLTDYICLPMPNNLSDINTFNYSPEAGNLLTDVVAQEWQDQADAYKTGGVDGIKSTLANLGQTVSRAGEGISGTAINVIKNSLTGALSQVANSGMQLLGLADNPFMTVLFKGGNFKQHSFQWRLSPRNSQETRVLRNIVDTLKKVAHPELLTAGVGGFYKFPNIVWPKFNPRGARDNLYKFKPCVITSIIANWSPNDRPGFFAGTEAPIECVLEIQLLEIELWRGGNGDWLSIKTGDFNETKSPPVRNLGKI